MDESMRTRIFIIVATLFIVSPAVAGDSWPQFRGPHGAGLSDATGLPVRWSENENIRWKTPIHDKGWSSPVVWGDQVWLTTARSDGKEMFAVCIERTTGKILHDIKVFDVESPRFCHPFNSYASPTPAIEEGRIYVHFGSYGTACLDTATGKILWSRRDFPCDHFRGPGSSPILFGDLLFVNFDGFDLQYVVALDKETGQTIWKKYRDIEYGTPDGDGRKAYGTPTVIEVNGRAQLVSPAAVATLAYDPATGRELWRVRHGGMNVAAPPLYGQGKVFLCTGAGGFRLLAARPDGSGDVTATHVDWKYAKAVPTRCSPILVGDLLYMVSEDGVVSCLDAKSGESIWQDRLAGQFSASPVLADGRLYFASQDAATYVLQPGRTFKVLSVNRLDDGCMASPAVARRSLFLRTKTHLYCIEQ
jgi:outer membrane protein assembly factor BamB